MRKLKISIVGIVLAIAISLVGNTTHVTADELLPVDVVFVLDVSLSMRTADPYQIANKAMNMFIDMLEIGRDQVGVVAYAGRVTYSRELTLLTYENVAQLQESINNLQHASWTDHPLGLLEAIHIMYARHTKERQPIIIFLTDGNFNIFPYGARTVAQAEYDKAMAISLAQERNIPIYSIGLNFDGALDRRYIQVVADETGGLAFETANAEDLPDILSVIYYLMIRKQLEPEMVIYEESTTMPTTAAEPTTTNPPTTEAPWQQPTYEPDNRSTIWPLLLFAAAVICVLIFTLLSKPKRVFTGRLAIEVIDLGNRQSSPVLYKNLIEYGKRTTLQKLIGNEISHYFNNVVLVPSPSAPSHLPQLLIKCRNPQVTFTKNFMLQDASKGINVNADTEVIISVEGEQLQIRIRYIL